MVQEGMRDKAWRAGELGWPSGIVKRYGSDYGCTVVSIKGRVYQISIFFLIASP